MGPATREEIVSEFEKVHRDGNAFWGRFKTEDFFEPLGDGWSPAENVRHLIKSTRPVVKALSLPKILLRLRFGRPRRTSVTFDELRDRYQQRLAEGVKAGKFTPSKQSEDDLGAWRNRIMSDRQSVHEALLREIGDWSDESLDRYQLPHPALGNLTVREILFFTVHHQVHHMNVVERKNGLQRRAVRSSGSSAE